MNLSLSDFCCSKNQFSFWSLSLLAGPIVLPENWTGGLDGESNETTIPSSEIYETTS